MLLTCWDVWGQLCVPADAMGICSLAQVNALFPQVA